MLSVLQGLHSIRIFHNLKNIHVYLSLAVVNKFLIIQTAFIGDVILATPIIESLKQAYPNARIDFMLRKGNESLFVGHPYLHKVYVWDKKKHKYSGLLQLLLQVRAEKYDAIINLQRFMATGVLTALSGAKYSVGFDKNPLSNFFTHKIEHAVGSITEPMHEVERNHNLLKHLVPQGPAQVKLYPTKSDIAKANRYSHKPYVTLSPASVWFTKQFPVEKWIALVKQLPLGIKILCLGGPNDAAIAEAIIQGCPQADLENLCGQYTLLGSAALMKGALMNYVNDSAPMHLASAMNAPTAAIYCSTIPQFGFGPRSEVHYIVETTTKLPCRPCGLHGKKACPEGHFRCAYTIDTTALAALVQNI